MSIQSRIYTLLLFATCAFSGCSREQDTLPTPSPVVNNTNVKVVNARLVFTDDESFKKIREDLWQKTSQELTAWENRLRFNSLRVKNINIQDTLSSGLMKEFGFPAQYAALINQNGEYQVGSKIYWFYDGFKYEASSESELARIKKNPSLATQKYETGKHIVSVKHMTLPANRTTRNGSSGGDGRYQTAFLLNNDGGSQRRLSLETFIFSEVTSYNPVYPGSSYNRTIYTSVVINEYCEYYSRGSRRWYRSGDQRSTSYDLNTTGWASGSNFAPPSGNSAQPVGAKGTPSNAGGRITTSNELHSNSDFQRGVANAVFYSEGDTNFAGILWDFEITGSYQAYLTGDSYKFYPNHTLGLNGVLW